MKAANFHLLKVLYKSHGPLDPFTVFRRSRLSFKDFSETVNALVAESFAQEVNGSLVITEKGRERLRNNSGGQNRQHWRAVPMSFLGSKMPVEEFYVPSISRLDKNTFKV